MKIQRHPAGRAAREIRQLRARLDTEHRFGPPSTFALSRRELAAEVGRRRRGGWQHWELRARFGRWAA
jgi:hypothetical protein